MHINVILHRILHRSAPVIVDEMAVLMLAAEKEIETGYKKNCPNGFTLVLVLINFGHISQFSFRHINQFSFRLISQFSFGHISQSDFNANLEWTTETEKPPHNLNNFEGEKTGQKAHYTQVVVLKFCFIVGYYVRNKYDNAFIFVFVFVI